MVLLSLPATPHLRSRRLDPGDRAVRGCRHCRGPGLRNRDTPPQRGVIAGYIRYLAREGRVLDVGRGQGGILRSLGREARYTGVDLSSQAHRRARHDLGDRGLPPNRPGRALARYLSTRGQRERCRSRPATHVGCTAVEFGEVAVQVLLFAVLIDGASRA